MNTRIQALVVGVAALSTLLAFPDDSFACSCIRELPAANAAFDARSEYQRWIANFNGVVFRGSVVLLENLPFDQAGPPEVTAMTRKVTFRVDLIAADPPERPVTTTCSAGFFKTENEAGFIAALGAGVPLTP